MELMGFMAGQAMGGLFGANRLAPTSLTELAVLALGQENLRQICLKH